MASTRFPGKPLCDLGGKPMIQWVYEAAAESDVADAVIVATPDQEILDACAAFGAEALLTSLSHPSGTDRIAEVAECVSAEVYVNVQGDEPLVDPEDIGRCAAALLDDDEAAVGTLAAPCDEAEFTNPAVVKVVSDQRSRALYFSRSAIPYARTPGQATPMRHIGMYAYRGDALRAFATAPPTPLELAEGLEQLRFMELGFRIAVAVGQGSPMAIDTPEQAEQVRQLLATSASPPR